MKVLLMTGSHPRHLYIAQRLLDKKLLNGLIIEEREEFTPNPPNGLLYKDKDNFIRHFKDREESEQKFLNIDFDDINKYKNKISVSKEEINSNVTKEFINNNEPDLVISYGIHKLNDDILDILPEKSFNIHGGLSPWYRGNITLFWPFYFLEPNMSGMTLHFLTNKIDGGNIIHHSVPKLEYGDGIHDVACKSVLKVTEDLIKILSNFDKREIVGVEQKQFGKVFISKDWKPQNLRLIYNTFDNDIVDKYLDGELETRKVNLVNFFEGK